MHWQIILWIAGVILALAWSSRVVEAMLGMPHVADIAKPYWDIHLSPAEQPRVSIIVPARNEEESIRATLAALLVLEYSNYEIIAVNDRSTEATGRIMDEVRQQQHGVETASVVNPFVSPLVNVPFSPASAGANGSVSHARLQIIHILDLPAGWLGKTHAMWRAAAAATGDWLLFTDADVLFKPDALRRAIAYAETDRADHVVLFPRMIMKQAGERMMIAFFQALFVFGHRPWKVANPKARDHMGVGAFNMVRRSAYEAIGGYEALRMEVLDDMKLGKVIKNAGFRQRCVFGEDLISLRWAKGAFGIVNNLTKNFYAVLSFQWWRTVATIVALGFLNLGPFLGVLVAHGWARVPYAVALFSMFAIYYGMSRRSAIPPYYFFLHPASTTLFIYTLAKSMYHALSNDGIVWRGTRYPLDELKKGLV